jgi:hypothetical protein
MASMSVSVYPVMSMLNMLPKMICIDTHPREHATGWLLEDARHHVADALISPALDCADLAERLRTNNDAVYADLARLDLVQLTLQAVCYAAYVYCFPSSRLFRHFADLCFEDAFAAQSREEQMQIFLP